MYVTPFIVKFTTNAHYFLELLVADTENAAIVEEDEAQLELQLALQRWMLSDQFHSLPNVCVHQLNRRPRAVVLIGCIAWNEQGFLCYIIWVVYKVKCYLVLGEALFF